MSSLPRDVAYDDGCHDRLENVDDLMHRGCRLMKLPRWFVIAMLATSISSVLVAGGVWWMTWPARTAMQFWNQLRSNNDWLLQHGRIEFDFKIPHMLRGEREFRIRCDVDADVDHVEPFLRAQRDYSYKVVRGRVYVWSAGYAGALVWSDQ